MPRLRLVVLFLTVFACAAFVPTPAMAVPPIVTSAIPDTTVTEDSPPIGNYRDLNTVFSDLEDGDSLAFTIELNSNPSLVLAAIDADSALDFSFTPNASGSATIVVRATDSEFLFAEDTLVVTVSPVNDPPVVFSAVADTVVLVDDPPVGDYVDLNDVFSDIEDGRALTYSVQSNSDPAAVQVSIDADSAIDLSFFPDTHGRATIAVRARDSGGLFVDETFIVTVHRTLWLVKADGSGHEPTIQAAVNMSFDGDTILLTDGIYTGGGNRGIGLGGREILITSENGPESTIIDLEGNDRAITMDDVGPGGVLSNITIKNGSQNQGACIKMSNASPTISGMILLDNAAGEDGGAIWCDGGSHPTITHCVLIGNSAQSGGGIYSNAASPDIRNCTIVESSATAGGAGIHFRNATTGTVSNTIIALSTQGAGLECAAGSSPTVSCTDIFGNMGGDALCGMDGGGNLSADPLFCGAPASGNVTINANSPCAPTQNSCGVLIGALSVACAPGPLLVDKPNTLYPDVTFADEPDLVLHLGLDNFSSTGVMLDTTSTVAFSDSTHTFSADLANPTYVPGGARNFTATFSAAPVPADMLVPASYDLRMYLSGVDDSAAAYADTITTTGRNSILVDTPKVIVSTLALGVTDALPGARNVPLLALRFQNGYTDDRALDSLVVTHMTFGPGTPAELDAEVERLYLFDDVDDSGDLSVPDTLVAQSSLFSAEATFATAGAWSVPAMGGRNLIVAADIDSTQARDGDEIDVTVVSPVDIVFQGATEINQDFSPLYPLNSFGFAVVDGMARHQIGVTPELVDTLKGGETDRWILTLVVPQNGYEVDTLTALSIKDYAGDFAPGDLASLDIYRDTGDGAFDPASDVHLGPLVFSGDRYEISGLAVLLSPSARFFIAADISMHAVNGHHFRPGVPLGGVEVASSNDGPVDAAVVSSKTHTFDNPEVVSVTNVVFSPHSARPGATDVRLLLLAVQNGTRQPVALDSLVLWNTSRGLGDIGDLDHTFSRVRIYKDDGNGLIDGWDTILGEDLVFAAGSLVVPDLGLAMAPDEMVHLLVAADIDSFCAADGDTIEFRVSGPQDIGITPPYPVSGSFPAATPAILTIDGMRAFQISVVPAADSLIVTRGSNVLLMDVGIPANGYAADTLETLIVRNEGTASSEHFARMALYVDGGDGVYSKGLGDDSHVGDFVENPAEPGRSFLLAGLSIPLTRPCGAHTRLFVGGEIASNYSVAGTIQFSIQGKGLTVASGNDGPIDEPVVDPSLMLIPKPDRLTVFPYPVGDRFVHPGSEGNLNCGLGFYNGYDNSFTLDAIRLYQAGTATSTEVESVFVHADANGNGLFDPLSDPRVCAVSSAGVSYLLGNLDVLLEPQKISYIFITYDSPLSVTDAATVDMRLFDSADITIEPVGSVIEGFFPINSPGTDTIDGMVASQIKADPVPAYRASPGDPDIPALNLVIPSNGIWADVLEYVSVENSGTADEGSEISGMRLWREAGGNPARFDPGTEEPIDDLVWNGTSWRNASPLEVAIPSTGLRCYATFSVSAVPRDGSTVTLRVPVDGIQVESGNDGPIDVAVTNPTSQTISTDPLISTLSTDRVTYSSGQAIVLSMLTRNAGPDTLYGVHASAISANGSGSASVSTTPNPAAVDLAPGARTTFVWTYTAGTAGDLDFCGEAYSADSSVVSEESCAGSVLIQNRPSGVSVALENLAPSSVNWGQQDVELFKLDTSYASNDPLAVPVLITGIVLRCEDRAGAPLAPNSAFQGIAIAAPSGVVHEFSLSDSTDPLLRLTWQDPVIVQPNTSIELWVACDIAASAIFTSFVLKLQALGDVVLTDGNDGSTVSATSANAFPWAITPVAINSPAERLLVDSGSGATTTVNFGQENVPVFTVDFTHPGDLNRARILVTDVKLGFFDLAGSPVTPASVVKRLLVTTGTTVLYDDDVVTGTGSTLSITLKTPLVISPGPSRPVDFRVDVRSVPQTGGFAFVLADSQSLVARDINTGRLVGVAPSNPSVRGFPFTSDRVIFQNPASGVIAASADRLPSTVLPSMRTIPVMDIIVTHGNTPPASSVGIDSLSVELSLSGGAAAYPGDYFSAMIVTHDGDTVCHENSLSGASPSVGCAFDAPVVVMPLESETLSVFVDAKALFSPVDVEVRIDQVGLVVHDNNDGTRIFGLGGEFPLFAGPVSLRLPAPGVSAGLVSRVPANVTAREPNVEAFDFLIRNGQTAGFTAVDLTNLRVRVEGPEGETIDPTGVASGARLVTSDSTVIDGTMSSSDISFVLPVGIFNVGSGASDTASVLLDIDTDLRDTNFRLAIEDASWVEVRDGVTSTRIPAGTTGAGFPLATRWIHVLGASAQGGYTNYPNPFAAGREKTTITYYLEQKSAVTLKLYTLWGAPVLTMIENESQPAGLYQSLVWDGRNGDGDVVNNGVYYLVLEIRGEDGANATLKRKVGVIR